MSNDVHKTASAIAAFDATQLAFIALVKKGVLSKVEAEEILSQAIKAIKTGATGDQAADFLRHAVVLEQIGVGSGVRGRD
jgi:hypothetical protein